MKRSARGQDGGPGHASAASVDALSSQDQHVTPGAFVAGMTLLTGLPQVIVSLVKALLFGLSAGLIACYKGLSVGGGPTAVGNAVNETVVFSFMALFLINILATAFGVKVAP